MVWNFDLTALYADKEISVLIKQITKRGQMKSFIEYEPMNHKQNQMGFTPQTDRSRSPKTGTKQPTSIKYKRSRNEEMEGARR